MGHTLREAAGLMIRYSGLPLLVRNTYARNKVTILFYHDPTPQVLEQHLRYLSTRYTLITLDLLVEAIRSRDWSGIPPKSLVITLDDGHRGNLALLPVFRKYQVRPTIYLVSKIVATGRRYWFQNRDVDVQQLKTYQNKRRLEALLERCRFTPTTEYPEQDRQALSADEIAAMAGDVDFQSHTCFHPVLTTCDNEECRREIFDSKSDLEALLKRECGHFSYPNGDYGLREVALVRDAGYRSARTIDLGWNHRKTDPHLLKALPVTDDASVNILAAQLTGLTGWLRRVLQGNFTGKHRPVTT